MSSAVVSTPATLGDLAQAVPGSVVVPPDAAGRPVLRVTHDSRNVTTGVVFACVPGFNVDGHVFAADAAASGAVAVVVDHRLDLTIPQVIVPDVRRALGPMAARAAGDPSRHLRIVGVTGTNGKTTTVSLLQAVLEHARRRPMVIGTLTGARTTPESSELQQALADHLRAGGETVAMEVSSHALDLGRVDGTRFAVGAFTTLGRDHLEHHGDLDAYFEAKARLFEPERCEHAVVFVGTSPMSIEILERRWRAGASAQPVTYGDAGDLVTDADGAEFTWRGSPVHLRLAGRHNVANALVAAACAESLGVEPDQVAAGLSSVRAVPGRFEPVGIGLPVAVVVDFAHTPDAVEHATHAAADLAHRRGGRCIAVFGAGGDRDIGKRPLMGAAAGRFADLVVVTSDNPRSEDPATIAAAIVAGIPALTDHVVELDRRQAITDAVARASESDVVIVMGKGHETTQEVAGEKTAFDDRVVAAEALRARGWEVEGW